MCAAFSYPAVESALRHLGTRTHDTPVDLIKAAIEGPTSDLGTHLAALIEPTRVLTDWNTSERAYAVWHIIREGIHAPDVGPTTGSRRRRALQAAFRIADPEINGPWGGSLSERFKQLRALKSVYLDASSTQPMEDAWRRGVQALARYVEQRYRELATFDDWAAYRPSTNERTVFRQPSPGAQPIFVNLFVTTVFMRERAVYRRITERLITAQADGVEYYTARGFAGLTPRLTYVPVDALWACRAEFIELRDRPAVTRLWFPRSLRKGEQAHFASEIIDENVAEERFWVDVDVDHHGIAPGELHRDGVVPVSGLTIRVRFEDGFIPEKIWWYAELNERERYDPPPLGDLHYVDIVENDANHTFVGLACQPREHYGLAFKWPET
jgi:hypothetical protein